MKNKFYLKALDKITEKKLAEAILFLDKAIEEEPNNPIYFSERGVCYLNLDQTGRALEDMNQSVKLDPDYAYRYASRAFVKDRMGDIEGGIADYEIAVKLEPEDAIAYNNLGMLQEKLGYKKASERNFKRADTLADENPNSLPDVTEEAANKENDNLKKDSSLPPVNSRLKSVELAKKENFGSVLTKIITDKNTRRDFWKFIKNGFMIK